MFSVFSVTVLYLSVQFDHANFGQFSDLRFFRGDLRVFDFFGNTHREAHHYNNEGNNNNKGVMSHRHKVKLTLM